MQINFYPQSIGLAIGFGLPLDVYSNPSIPNQSYKDLLAKFSSKESFEEMWQKKFAGQTFYHVMDTSSFPQWSSRLDFPFEKFFTDQVDPSILNWQPTSTNPSQLDSTIQRRIESTLGKNVVIVPPSLDEKLKSDSKLTAEIMKKVDRAFEFNREPIGAPRGSIIALDEDGEIAYGLFTSGGRITQSIQNNFMEDFGFGF